jgi:type VI secretion system secreted protein Hcp
MRLALAAALALPLLTVSLPAAAALTAYVSIRADGTDLQCETSNPAFQNHAEAIAVATNVILPVSGSGQVTGSRQHAPIRITKRLDKCTPLLAQALVSGQQVDAVIKLVRPEQDGTVVHYFTIEITRGRLVGQSLVLPDTLDASTADLPALEHLSFTFQTITWRSVLEGNEATDNLQTP